MENNVSIILPGSEVDQLKKQVREIMIAMARYDFSCEAGKMTNTTEWERLKCLTS